MRINKGKFNRQRGLILPLTLSFMMISQLSYWGLLHLNQTQLFRLQQMSAYYQAEIQQMITENQLAISNLENLNDSLSLTLFSDFLNFQEQNLARLNLSINFNSDDHFILPQYGWVDIADNSREQKILVYQMKVFFDHKLFSFILTNPEIYFSGLLSNNLFPQDFTSLDPINPNPFPFSIHELLEGILQEDYRLIKKFNQRKIYNWSFDAWKDKNIEIIFDSGKTIFSQHKAHYQIESQTNFLDLKRLTSYPVPQGNYLLEWDGYLFLKNK